MFFVRLGTFLAWLGLAFGLLFLVMGFYFGSQLPVEDPRALAEAQAFLERRYGATSGEMVSRGTYLVLGSVVLGILAKIARN